MNTVNIARDIVYLKEVNLKGLATQASRQVGSMVGKAGDYVNDVKNRYNELNANSYNNAANIRMNMATNKMDKNQNEPSSLAKRYITAKSALNDVNTSEKLKNLANQSNLKATQGRLEAERKKRKEMDYQRLSNVARNTGLNNSMGDY